MSSSFSVDGLISGLKTTDLIDKMMQIEQQPLVALKNKQTAEAARQTAWSAVKTSFSSLQTAISKLALRSTANAKSAVTDTPTTSPAVISASVGSDAANGTFSIKVKQLATATSATSSGHTGGGINIAAAPDVAGFNTAITTTEFSPGVNRFFTINGKRIEIDPNAAGSVSSLVSDIQDKVRTAFGDNNWSITLEADALGRPDNALRITAPDQ